MERKETTESIKSILEMERKETTESIKSTKMERKETTESMIMAELKAMPKIIPGFDIMQELLNYAKETIDPTHIDEDDNDDTDWAEVIKETTFTCWTRYLLNRKMTKTQAFVNLTLDETIECFLDFRNDRVSWDPDFSKCDIVKDYVAENLHDENRIPLDHIAAIKANLPEIVKWFFALGEMDMRMTVEKDPEKNVYYYCVVSWDTQNNQRNMKHKIRKYGKIEQHGDQCSIITVEKSGRWMPDWAVARVVRKNAKNMIMRKVANYQKKK